MEIKNAIANLKFYIDEDPFYNGTYNVVTDFEKYCLNHCQDISIVLAELDSKQDDINILEAQRDSIENQFEQAKAILEKQKKIINEMAKSIAHNNDIDYEICDNVHEKGISCGGYSRETNQTCENCIKEYFIKKVEG